LKQHALPPLKWLRAFEAAGRLGSFKDAAASLNVTPSTVSHQVRDLESFLGVPLFERSARQIRLTEEGRQYIAPLTTAFELIASAGDALVSRHDRLRIGAFPFLLHEVLTPNVAGLKAALDIERLSLHAETSRESLITADPKERLDVVIRYSRDGDEPGFLADRLFDIELVPIQSADQLPVQSLDALLAAPVVRVVSPFDAWRLWREAFGVAQREQDVVLETDSYHSAVLAVSRGEGICLGIMPFLKPWLHDGRVRALDQYRISIEDGSYLVYAPHNRDHPAIPKLKRWFQQVLG